MISSVIYKNFRKELLDKIFINNFKQMSFFKTLIDVGMNTSNDRTVPVYRTLGINALKVSYLDNKCVAK